MEQQVFGKPKWNSYCGKVYNKPEETEGALANYIQETDDNFFKSVEPFTFERQKLQSKVIQLYAQLC